MFVKNKPIGEPFQGIPIPQSTSTSTVITSNLIFKGIHRLRACRRTQNLPRSRNSSKCKGKSWKSKEFPSKILKILSESSKSSSRGGSGPRRDLDPKNIKKPKISSKMASGLHKMHRNGFKRPQNIVLQYFEMIPGGLSHFSDPFLRSMVFF